MIQETDLQEAVEDLGQSDIAPLECKAPELKAGDYKPKSKSGFWHNGKAMHSFPTPLERCPHCSRPYDDVASLGDDERKEIRETALRDVLQFLASGNDLKRMGWRCALSHWLIFRCESQQEFADRLKVSAGAISQGLKAFRVKITQCLQTKEAPKQSSN